MTSKEEKITCSPHTKSSSDCNQHEAAVSRGPGSEEESRFWAEEKREDSPQEKEACLRGVKGQSASRALDASQGKELP